MCPSANGLFVVRDYGLGKDMWTIPFDDIRQILKLFFIEEEMYCVCIAAIKVSMLCLYLNIFPNRGLRIATYIVLAITLVWAIVSFFVLLFSCNPISYYWNMWDGEHSGKCIDHDSILLAHSSVNIVLDVLIVAIPMPTLAKLHMRLEKKLGVCLMFAVGIVYASLFYLCIDILLTPPASRLSASSGSSKQSASTTQPTQHVRTTRTRHDY